MPNRSLTLLPTVVIDSEADESPNHIPILSPLGRTETTAPFTYDEKLKLFIKRDEIERQFSDIQ